MWRFEGITCSIIEIVTDGRPLEIDLLSDGVELYFEIGDAGRRYDVRVHVELLVRPLNTAAVAVVERRRMAPGDGENSAGDDPREGAGQFTTLLRDVNGRAAALDAAHAWFIGDRKETLVITG